MRPFPQVLLIGNGLNRADQSRSWNNLLEKISYNQKLSLDKAKEIPFPLQAVLATNDHIDIALKEHQRALYGNEHINKTRLPIRRLLSIPFDHILTTNYSYELERVANEKIQVDGEYCKHLVRNIKSGERAEPKYLLHTYNEVLYGENTHKIWHIHGEARKPQSVILGHYYYGNLLGRYQKELENRENDLYRQQCKGEPPIIKSWLDAFIMGDVYVLGFGFDFSEMDMWWLLSRKKREKAKHGGLFFYEPSFDKEVKTALIRAYDGECRSMGFEKKGVDYLEFYDKAISDIQTCVEQKKGVVIHA